jgi:hypothetical protein
VPSAGCTGHAIKRFAEEEHIYRILIVTWRCRKINLTIVAIIRQKLPLNERLKKVT